MAAIRMKHVTRSKRTWPGTIRVSGGPGGSCGYRSRGWRRHHYERLKAKRWHYYGSGRGFHSRAAAQHAHNDAAAFERHLGMRVSTMPACSCPMCGNPRRWFGEQTIQERRADGWEREIHWDSGDYADGDAGSQPPATAESMPYRDRGTC